MGRKTFSSADVVRIWQTHLTEEEQLEVLDFFVDEGVLRLPEGPDDDFITIFLGFIDEIAFRARRTMVPTVDDPELDVSLPPGTVRRAAFDSFVRLGAAPASPMGRRLQFVARATAIRGGEVRRQRAEETSNRN